ncbi:MAG: signal peptidase I [Ferrimicrobium sp.]
MSEATGRPRPGRSQHRKKMGRWQRSLRRWIVVLAVGFVVAFAVRTYVFESFYVPSGSMIPTLEIGDHMIVDKLSYRLHPVGFGDIVVFHTPANDHTSSNIHYLVKRVIGLAGQTIWSHDGKVYVDGHPLAEPFLAHAAVTRGIRRQVVPKGDLYVLGDNRDNSCDSRCFGPISASSVVGRVVLIYWPFGRWRVF